MKTVGESIGVVMVPQQVLRWKDNQPVQETQLVPMCAVAIQKDGQGQFAFGPLGDMVPLWGDDWEIGETQEALEALGIVDGVDSPQVDEQAPADEAEVPE